MVESGNNSTKGLIIVSKLYQEGKIDDDQREQLKEMIFSEDAILMSLLDRGYDDEEDIKDAVLSYCNRGAVSSSAQKRSEMQQQPPAKMFQMQFGGGAGSQQQQEQPSSQNEAASELFDATSPVDGAIDMKKRKRLNQLAAKQKQQETQQQQVQMQMNFGPQGGHQAQAPQTSMISFGISDCDLGASPQMTKGSLISKATQHQLANPPIRQSPLAVQSRKFGLGKNPSSGAGGPSGGN